MYMHVWHSHENGRLENGQLIPAKRTWAHFIVAYMTNIAAEINWTQPLQ